MIGDVLRIVSDDSSDNDLFGYSLSMSGNRLAVGAYQASADAVSSAGAVYVFQRTGAGWFQIQKVVSDAPVSAARFGFSVSLDGDRLVVGEVRGNALTGAVYVFEFDGAEFIQDDKFTPGDLDVFDQFGYSVSAKGDRVIVGAPFHSTTPFNNNGAVYVFDKAGTWSQAAKLTVTAPIDQDNLGYSVSLDTDRLVAGTPTRAGAGSAWVFDLDGTWSQTQELTSVGTDELGTSVSLKGSLIAVGDVDPAGNGATVVFEYVGPAWAEKQVLTATGGAAGDKFGASVSVADDGTLIVVGAPFADGIGTDRGAAYLYEQAGLSYTELLQLSPDVPEDNSYFGKSASIYGSRAAIGAYAEDSGGSGRGAVYIFNIAEEILDLCCSADYNEDGVLNAVDYQVHYIWSEFVNRELSEQDQISLTSALYDSIFNPAESVVVEAIPQLDCNDYNGDGKLTAADYQMHYIWSEFVNRELPYETQLSIVTSLYNSIFDPALPDAAVRLPDFVHTELCAEHGWLVTPWMSQTFGQFGWMQ